MVNEPWNLYWHGDNLASCIARQFAGSERAIAGLWQSLAAQLNESARVLDLACGNGAVPLSLLQANAGLDICGVDQADIDPLRFLSGQQALASVRFMPGIDICELPFADGSFDAVTSQFGLEYAPLQTAIESAARVLVRGGKLQLLMHHGNSDISRSSAARRGEIDRLLEEDGLVCSTETYVAGRLSLAALESRGEAFLQDTRDKTRDLSGQIMTGIDMIVTEMKTQPAVARERLVNMKRRLEAEGQRLRQLSDAALDEGRAAQAQTWMEQAGLRIDLFQAFTIADAEAEEVLIGWQVSGERS